MSRLPASVITVSPPNLDRTGFLNLQMDLAHGDGPLNRDWLLERFAEGFQVRMLRPPQKGCIEFAPGRASWRPVLGAQRSVVVHALKVAGQGAWEGSAGCLLEAAENWARYYDFEALLYPASGIGEAEARGLRRRGYALLEQTVSGVDLWAKMFQGPMALPRFAQDWQARARRLGPGLVVQSAGHCSRQLTRGYALVDRARAQGMVARLRALRSADEARDCLVTPRGFYAVVLEGQIIDDGQLTAQALWQEVCRRNAP